jgi:predicted MFS family arabinose efflux permease
LAKIAERRSGVGAGLALALLFLVATINFVDRQILVILLQPIKEDLDLSDTQLGLLTGVAYSLCFAVAGIPLARLAETASRRTIVTLSLAAWSLLTAACGLAQTFVQLMAARVLVAVAESGSGPASQSMTADLYPHRQRATTLAVLSCSIPVGVVIGLVAGGVLNEQVGWRNAFVLVGLPGVALAAILFLVVKEPQREGTSEQIQNQPTLAALKELWSIRSYRFLVLAAAIHLFAAAGLNQWIASYLIRTYGLGTKDVGLSLGLIIGVVGGVSVLLGGYFGDRLGRRHARWLAWLPALIAFGGAPLTIAMYFAPSFQVCLLLFIGPVIAATAYAGPVFGAIQSLAPPHLRTTAAALTMLFGGVIGQAGGPLVVGALSDLLQPTMGEDSLRWALVAIAPVSILAGCLFWIAGRTMREDLSRTQPTSAPKSAG